MIEDETVKHVLVKYNGDGHIVETVLLIWTDPITKEMYHKAFKAEVFEEDSSNER